MTQIIIDARDMRTLVRGRNGYERCQRGGYRNAIFNSIKDRALDGQFIKFNVIVPYQDTLILFEPDAFGDVDQHTVAFRVDHESSFDVATTDNGLSLVIDDDAIQFRLDLEQSVNGYVIAHMCEIGNRETMSIGFEILDERNKTIDGHSVRVISRARLIEGSLVNNGAAGVNAFAYLVDTTVTPKPVAGARSKKFQTYNAIYKLSSKLRAIKTTNTAVLALHERLALLGSEHEPIDWSMTIDQSNRLETDRNDQMRIERRARI